MAPTLPFASVRERRYFTAATAFAVVSAGFKDCVSFATSGSRGTGVPPKGERESTDISTYASIANRRAQYSLCRLMPPMALVTSTTPCLAVYLRSDQYVLSGPGVTGYVTV